MALPVTMTCLRHGQSLGNEARRRWLQEGDRSLQDAIRNHPSASWPLTPLGVNQAKTAGEWLKTQYPYGFQRCIVSPFVRAAQTAALLDLPNAEWFVEPAIAERLWGHLEARVEDDVLGANHLVDHYQERFRDGVWWTPLGGEGLATVATTRVHGFFGELHHLNDEVENIIVVCHGEIILSIRHRVERISMEEMHRIMMSQNPYDKIHNCQIIEYTRQNPFDQDEQPREHFTWRRSVCPWDTHLSTNRWREIVRPTYTNEELLANAARRACPINLENFE